MSVVSDADKVAETATAAVSGDPIAVLKLFFFVLLILVFVTALILILLNTRQAKTEKGLANFRNAIKSELKDVNAACVSRYEQLARLEQAHTDMKERTEQDLKSLSADIDSVDKDLATHQATYLVEIKTFDKRMESLEEAVRREIMPLLVQIKEDIGKLSTSQKMA